MHIKLFHLWDISGIHVEDPGLKKYVTLTPVFVPHAAGRNAKSRFGKTKSNIVERLMGKLMVPGHKGKKHKLTSGHITGKGAHVYQTVIDTFTSIERDTKENPVKVFIKAIENAAPREEITTIEYGGARYPQAVECAPQRRIDIALRQMVQGAYTKCFDSKITLVKALSDEIIKSYRMDQTSQAISKKLELERQADSSR
ncbi:30S ribosomal protein S7 [Candidatus Woesearchaeota archaeon]|nr:30S ribosomal protein S7 [Candidatus Woesearchaeota archaeon]